MALAATAGSLSCLALAILGLFACSPIKQIDRLDEGRYIDYAESLSHQLKVGPAKSLGIHTDALGLDFLLQSIWIDQQPLPQMQSLRSRIVRFAMDSDSIIMFESAEGRVIASELPSQVLIARFPIREQQGDWLYFDFGGELRNIDKLPEWPNRSSLLSPAQQEDFQTLDSSYTEAIEVEDTHMVLRQLARSKTQTLELKYYLEPYRTNSNFEPAQAVLPSTLGFFASHPRYTEHSQASSSWLNRWDMSRPIVFALSSNTPAAYREAVIDGALYWNQALGRELVQVIDAPEGFSAPDYDYNIIQWVTWDDAPYAFADAQIDPRTGEVRHAQIFLSSVFAVKGAAEARRLLLATKAKKTATVLGSRGFCADAHAAKFMAIFNQLLLSEAEDAVYQRVSADIVREIVAHEIGHTLGLRHNFAGSIGRNFPLSQHQEILHTYLQQAQLPPNLAPANSVMDYFIYEEAALLGHIIAQKQTSLAYDRQAIRQLYFDEIPEANELFAFCSDEHEQYIDCLDLDSGTTPLEALSYQLTEQNPLGEELWLWIQTARTKQEPALFNADEWTDFYFGSRDFLQAILRRETALVQVRQLQKPMHDGLRAEWQSREQQLLTSSLMNAGGWQQLLHLPSDETWTEISTELDQKMALYSPQKDDQPPAFTARERLALRQQLASFLPILRRSLEERRLKWIAGVQLEHASFSQSFLEWLEPYSERQLLTLSYPAQRTQRKISGQMQWLELPKFEQSASFRSALSKTLASMQGDEAWRRARLSERLHEQLKRQLELALPDFTRASLSEFDQTGAAWLNDNRAILKQLQVGFE